MTLLWPRLPDGAARQNLRQAVYILRQTLPEVSGPGGGGSGDSVPLLLSDYHTVRINPNTRYELDLAAFRYLAGADESNALERACALYRGDFLTDLYLDDSNAFEEWAVSRQALRSQALKALEALAGRCLDRGDYEQAEVYARRQIAIEPLQEEGHRQLIEALARAGRRSAALVAYGDLKDVLKRELDVAPMVEIQQLVTQIRAGSAQAMRHDSALPLGLYPATSGK